MMRFYDRLTLDGGRRTKDGYFVTSVRAARTGVQLYSGADVGRPDLRMVRVYRPPEEVFNKDSLSSFAFRPVVIGHPGYDVDVTNWRDLSRGITGGDVVRDGDYVRISMAIMDEGAIKTVEDGMNEISMGYDAVLEFKDGVTPSGEAYDAIQRQQRMNHLAIVSTARGGSELRIGDEERSNNMANRMVMVDGLSVETTDQGAQAIEKLMRDLKIVKDQAATDKATSDKAIVDLRAEVSKKDGEFAIAKKAIEDSKLTPDKLDAAVVARTQLITDAKLIAGDNVVVAGKTDAEIRRAAVATKLGDEAVKAMDDAAISGAFVFAAKSADGKSAPSSGLDPLRIVLGESSPVSSRKTADAAYDKYVEGLQDGWKTPQHASER